MLETGALSREHVTRRLWEVRGRKTAREKRVGDQEARVWRGGQRAAGRGRSGPEHRVRGRPETGPEDGPPAGGRWGAEQEEAGHSPGPPLPQLAPFSAL